MFFSETACVGSTKYNRIPPPSIITKSVIIDIAGTDTVFDSKLLSKSGVNTGARNSDKIEPTVESCTSPFDSRVHTIALPAVVGAASIIAKPVLVPPDKNRSTRNIPITGIIP